MDSVLLILSASANAIAPLSPILFPVREADNDDNDDDDEDDDDDDDYDDDDDDDN